MEELFGTMSRLTLVLMSVFIPAAVHARIGTADVRAVRAGDRSDRVLYRRQRRGPLKPKPGGSGCVAQVSPESATCLSPLQPRRRGDGARLHRLITRMVAASAFRSSSALLSQRAALWCYHAWPRASSTRIRGSEVGRPCQLPTAPRSNANQKAMIRSPHRQGNTPASIRSQRRDLAARQFGLDVERGLDY